jgi:hypothetical protein
MQTSVSDVQDGGADAPQDIDRRAIGGGFSLRLRAVQLSGAFAF